jgi:hypothetical protein
VRLTTAIRVIATKPHDITTVEKAWKPGSHALATLVTSSGVASGDLLAGRLSSVLA